MGRPAAHEYLYIRDQPVLSLAEFESYVYGIAENAVPPRTLVRWMNGEQLEVDELLECLRGEAAEAAGTSDEALVIVRVALERLQRLFPGETGSRR